MSRKPKRVPWLLWVGGPDWRCDRCRASGTFPIGCTIDTFLRFARDLVREHADCPEPPPEEPPGADVSPASRPSPPSRPSGTAPAS